MVVAMARVHILGTARGSLYLPGILQRARPPVLVPTLGTSIRHLIW